MTSSWERLLAATAAIDAFQAEVRANQIALEGVQQEALVGARTVLDVLDAEQELFTSQVNLVRARPRGDPGQLPAQARRRPADGRRA